LCLLEARDLSLGYRLHADQKLLFQHLDLALYAGQLVCLMGPNGIGKSTLLRVLAGFQPPMSGEVLYPGKAATQDRYKHLAVVLTDRIPAADMTVREFVTFGRYPYLDWALRLSDQDNESIFAAIKEVQIEHLAENKLDELSDGQRQMAMIARALAQNTPVLLLDEPTTHLDLNNRVEIMSLLRKIARSSGKAILVTTHEMDLALQTADLIWLATRNKTIATGFAEDLILNGSFDEVFQLKGYDLKTGKVNHDAHHKTSVRLSGEGPEYLWTKNALERSGFQISEDAFIHVTIMRTERLSWQLTDGQTFVKLETLVEELKAMVK
jgi:iron complex transport system ATP-binding protein